MASWPPELSELNAAVYGIEVAIRMGYTHIVLEGDCASVIKEIQNKATGLAPQYMLFSTISASKHPLQVFDVI